MPSSGRSGPCSLRAPFRVGQCARLFWSDWAIQDAEGLHAELAKRGGSSPPNCERHVLRRNADRGPALTGRALAANCVEPPRWKPEKQPPYLAYGLDACRTEVLEAWTDSSFVMAPYHFQRRNCMTLRDASADVMPVAERKQIMGLKAGYTAAAVPSGSVMSDPRRAFSIPASFLGNAIHVHTLEWLLSHLAVERKYLTRMPSRRDLCEGRAHLLMAPPLLTGSKSRGRHERAYSEVQHMVALLTC